MAYFLVMEATALEGSEPIKMGEFSVMIRKNNSTEYLLGEMYWRPLMNGLTAAELERPPLNKWKTIMKRVPVYLAASEFLKSTPHQ